MYNIGIIGYGGFGKFLHNAWKMLDNIRVTAVADKTGVNTENLYPIKVFTEKQPCVRPNLPNYHRAISAISTLMKL